MRATIQLMSFPTVSKALGVPVKRVRILVNRYFDFAREFINPATPLRQLLQAEKKQKQLQNSYQ